MAIHDRRPIRRASGRGKAEYEVTMIAGSSPIIEGISDFQVKSEQYYMHVDPAVHILATTKSPVVEGPHSPNGTVDMPVIWTKRWGKGRVFYCSLGHKANILEEEPVLTIMKRGFIWTAEGKQANQANQ